MHSWNRLKSIINRAMHGFSFLVELLVTYVLFVLFQKSFAEVNTFTSFLKFKQGKQRWKESHQGVWVWKSQKHYNKNRKHDHSKPALSSFQKGRVSGKSRNPYGHVTEKNPTGMLISSLLLVLGISRRITRCFRELSNTDVYLKRLVVGLPSALNILPAWSGSSPFYLLTTSNCYTIFISLLSIFE